MKKIIITACTLAALSFISCNDNETVVPNAQKANISLSASLESATKTVIADDGTTGVSAWKEGDQIDLFFANAAGTWNQADATLTYDGTQGKFTGTVTAGSYDAVYLVYPAGLTINSSTKVLYNPYATTVTQTKDDPTAHIKECMWGSIGNITVGEGTELNATMQRKSSVIKFSITHNGSKEKDSNTILTELTLVESPYLLQLQLSTGGGYNAYIDIATGESSDAGSKITYRNVALSGYTKLTQIDKVYIPVARDLVNTTSANSIYFYLTYKEKSNVSAYTWNWRLTGRGIEENKWVRTSVETIGAIYDEGGAIELPFVPF